MFIVCFIVIMIMIIIIAIIILLLLLLLYKCPIQSLEWTLPFIVKRFVVCLSKARNSCSVQELQDYYYHYYYYYYDYNCVNNKMLKYDWLLTALIYGFFRSKLSDYKHL